MDEKLLKISERICQNSENVAEFINKKMWQKYSVNEQVLLYHHISCYKFIYFKLLINAQKHGLGIFKIIAECNEKNFLKITLIVNMALASKEHFKLFLNEFEIIKNQLNSPENYLLGNVLTYIAGKEIDNLKLMLTLAENIVQEIFITANACDSALYLFTKKVDNFILLYRVAPQIFKRMFCRMMSDTKMYNLLYTITNSDDAYTIIMYKLLSSRPSTREFLFKANDATLGKKRVRLLKNHKKMLTLFDTKTNLPVDIYNIIISFIYPYVNMKLKLLP